MKGIPNIQQRARSVRVPEHARQIVHVSRKPRLALPPRPVHLRRLRQQNELAEYQSLNLQNGVVTQQN